MWNLSKTTRACGTCFPNCGQVGIPHVGCNDFDRTFLGRTEGLEELREALDLSTIGDVQNSPTRKIAADGDVLVVLLKGGLIDAELHHGFEPPPLEPPADRPLENSVDGIPAQSQLPGDRLDIRLSQPIDDETLEQSRESRLRLGPRNDDLVYAIPRAIDSWDLSDNHRPVLHSVQMTPLAVTAVVSSGLVSAHWARNGSVRSIGDHDVHCLFLLQHLDADDLPWPGDSEDRRIEFMIVHGPMIGPRLDRDHRRRSPGGGPACGPYLRPARPGAGRS